MDNKNQQRKIDPRKIRAEKLNSRFAPIGVITIVGTYISKGQIILGIV